MLGNFFEYPAACTRTRGVRAKLLSDSDWKNLANSNDLFSTLNYLVETEYRPFFDWTTLHADALPSLRRVEHNLRSSTVSYIINILRFLSGAPAEILVALIQKYELLNIKKTVRRLNQPPREDSHLKIENYNLGRFALCPKTDWDAIKNFDDLADSLKSTYYRYAYEKGRNLVAGGDLMLFECLLEKVYYDYLISIIENIEKNNTGAIRSLFSFFFDEICLATFVRLKYDHNLDFSSTLPLLPLKGGKYISERLLEKLSSATDKDEFFERLAEDANCKNFAANSLKLTVANIRRARKKACSKTFAAGLTLSVAPEVAFYFLKEQEVDDLISLLQCKRFSIDVTDELICANF